MQVLFKSRQHSLNTYAEASYKELVKNILAKGKNKTGRNGNTISLFGTQLKFDATHIPLLNGRKIFINGVLGEFAAFMQNKTNVYDIKKLGCNYWDDWAGKEGILKLDYINQLHSIQVNMNNGWYSQLEALKIGLRNDPMSRRHIINLWVPDNLHLLSLPCCHYSYQFLVDEDNKLHMIWTQRSADTMVGIPSDMILAYLWVQCLSKELGFKPGEVTMNFGDTHIYEEHISGAKQYLEVLEPRLIPIATLNDKFTGIEQFYPDQLDITQYEPHPAIKFELKV